MVELGDGGGGAGRHVAARGSARGGRYLAVCSVLSVAESALMCLP
jgi:hypothetical protein